APTSILDAGCGIGGSSLYLAEKYSASVTGITLSPVQAVRAQQRAMTTGLGDRVSFQVADALATPFPTANFDLVWSLESGEHMPDKAAFLQECYRVLKPGGQLLLATWCHRPTASLAGPLTAAEQRHLQAIYEVYYLPYVISLPEYEAIASDSGFVQLRADDWSTAVAPFWDEVIRSALDPRTWPGILQAGPDTLRGAIALWLMRQGYASGLVRFGLLTARKPGE
ncbi:MAG: methyltransferase domain-containing protein, partial [Spirulinaceae cyanobacterium RM2_2_10]|nr:methyltransferase domain-containing protein [Spirulinaceae cyanobacterium RM2_2_10]